MSEILITVINAPFRALEGLINFLLFPPKPLTPEEQLLQKVRGQHGQIRNLQEENSSLQSSLQEQDSKERNLRDQLDKKEADIERLLKKVQDLENQLYQAWDRLQR